MRSQPVFGFFLLLVVVVVVSVVRCELTLGEVRCGQKNCKQWEYCSEFDKTCQPCKGVCDDSTHNFDRSLCEKDCQDYLHDQRYVRLDGRNEDDDRDLRNTVHRLSHMVTVTLTLVCLMLLVLASVFCFQLYRWKVPDDSSKPKNNVPATESKKNELRLEMPATITQSDHSPVTVTTSISRRPAEDSTLDYAYDNPAMSGSPKERH
ncbi:hypothetical protein NQ315_016383 [Exocentrus adspersus]|uniref:Uncharacterized protein n=1 Tax=Exocentrus adspersus TaxID=1586481 RepID=A0AAV8VQJ9_9CUCU|nr:hypothetical protein NQ315_016383 [Exocentrus adspersus]